MDVLLSSDVYRASIYCRQYNDLVRTWNLNKATDLLVRRPECLGQSCSQLLAPNVDRINDRWLLLSILYYAPQCNGSAYWLPILKQLHIHLSDYDSLDLKELADTRFVDTLFRCYSILAINRIKWAIDDLKDCIRNGAPDLWKALHPLFSLPKSTWKKIGGEQISGDTSQIRMFADWLLKGK